MIKLPDIEHMSEEDRTVFEELTACIAEMTPLAKTKTSALVTLAIILRCPNVEMATRMDAATLALDIMGSGYIREIITHILDDLSHHINNPQKLREHMLLHMATASNRATRYGSDVLRLHNMIEAIFQPELELAAAKAKEGVH